MPEQETPTYTREDLEKAWIIRAVEAEGIKVDHKELRSYHSDKYYRFEAGKKTVCAYVEAGQTGLRGAQVFLCIQDRRGNDYSAYALFSMEGCVSVIKMTQPSTTSMCINLFRPLMLQLVK